MKTFITFTAICLIGCCALQAKEKPATLELPLKVSDNKHYLVGQKGMVFFPVVDTAWTLGYVSEGDVVTYLDNRKSKGFNTVYMAPFMFTNTNSYGEFVFKEKEWFGDPNPKYWDHIQYILDQIKQRGMQVWFVVEWANYNDHLVDDLPRAEKYISFLQNRFPVSEYPNLIWVLGGDPNKWDKSTVKLWNRMGNHIKKSGDPRLVSFHPGGAKISQQYFTKAESNWIDFHQLQSAHGADTAAPYQKMTTLTFDRPIINGEPLYELIKPEATEEDVRQAIYQSLFSGGFGVVYGVHGVWGIGRDLPFGGVAADENSWRANMDAPASFDMVHIAKLMQDYPFYEASSGHLSGQIVTPRKVASGSYKEKAGSYAATLVANDGKWAAVYFPDIGRDENRSIKIDLGKLSQPDIRARWFDPASGSYGGWSRTYDNTGMVEFTAPGKNSTGASSDWVLVLDNRPQHMAHQALNEGKQANVQMTATTKGLVAFWDFNHAEDKVWGTYFDPKIMDRSFPVKLKRIGDPKSYTADIWPYVDDKSILKTDKSGPFGKALRFNKSYIYASVDRKEFDGTLLDLHGKMPFTLIAWCKFVGKRHLVAGIWDEGGWARYEGRRQIAIFGGMFQQKGVVAHISATGAASFPQSNHKYASTARIAAMDPQPMADHQWAAMATCFDPVKGELTAYLNGKMLAFDYKEIVAADAFQYKEKQPFNPLPFHFAIASPRAFVIKYNGYHLQDGGISEHRLSVDLNARTLLYEREKSQGKVSSDEESFRLFFDVKRDDKSLLKEAMKIKAAHLAKAAIPLSVEIKAGDVVYTRLEQQQQGEWKQVGTEIKRVIREGAPFTFGTALGLGSDAMGKEWGPMGLGAGNLEYGSQIYIDGVAVFNRVLTGNELKKLSFGLGE